jgi:hypothetical protein
VITTPTISIGVSAFKGGAMPNLVCTGATLQCSMGTSPATFAATGQTPTAGAPAGVVTDTDAACIPPFGMCQSLANPQVASATAAAQGALTPQPCMPVIAGPWTPGSSAATVDDVAALDDASQCSCSWGGSITVTAAGQQAVTLE